MGKTERMQELSFAKEIACHAAGFDVVVGVDEAGRGPLAGPVVAAATALRMNDDLLPPPRLEDSALPLGQGQGKRNNLWLLVRDSKTLSEKQREKMFAFVQEHFFVGVGVIHPETIDRINILEATFLAMKEAVGSLRRTMNDQNDQEKNTESTHGRELILYFEEAKTVLLVDGNMTIPNLSLPQEAIVDGDALVRSIAAASIVAKVTRDRMMLEYDKEYPAYGFAQHKGYGTKTHMDALRKYGPCPIHRMSFKPVYYSIPENVNRNLLPNARRKRA